MAVKKEATKKQADTQATGMVLVDARKLGLGLKTTFEGVAIVFDSIGIDADITMTVNEGAEEDVIRTAKSEDTREAEKIHDTKEAEADEPENTESSDDCSAADSDVSDDADDKDEMTGDPDAVPAEATSKKHLTTTITLDDVTKIIVQKIRQDRSNNEKIGQILKTYGAGKVSELPDEKYEAFLTDLAAL